MSIKNQVTASFAQIANYDASGNITGITVPAANLGAIANVKITGGSNSQFLQTDGTGNLSFATVSSSSLTNGNSNVIVTLNGNVSISSTGNANVLVVTGSGANITGIANVTGNIVTNGNLSSTGDISTAGNVTAKYYLGNGSQLIGITTSAGGANTQIQYNSNGAFAASSKLTYIDATGTLEVQGQYLQTFYNGTSNTHPTLRGYNSRGTNAVPITVVAGDDTFRIRTGAYTGNGSTTINLQPGWTDTSLLWNNVAAISADSSNIASNLYLQTFGLSGNSQTINQYVLDNTGNLTVPGNINSSNANLGTAAYANQFFGSLSSTCAAGLGYSNVSFGPACYNNIIFSAAGMPNLVTITGNIGVPGISNSFIIGANTTANLGVLNNWQVQANTGNALISPYPGATIYYNGTNWGFGNALIYQNGVNYATTSALSATYDNGTSGVGATLTNNITPFTVLNIDGVVPSGRVLVKNQSNAAQNGVYDVTFIGNTISPWILTRSTDFDTPQQMLAGSFFYVSSGNTLSNTYWVLANSVTTVGTSAVNFAYSGIATLQNVTTGGNTTSIPVSFSSNVSNAAITTTIANGTVQTGNGIITGADSGNLFTITARNSLISGNSNYNMFYTGANAGEIRFGGSNATPIFTFGMLQANGIVSPSTTALQIRPLGSEVRINSLPGTGVTNANLRLEATGSGNINVQRGNLNVPGFGTLANLTVNNDQVASFGAADAGNSNVGVNIGIQSANSTYAGYRITKAGGYQTMFWGQDNTGNIGNVTLDTPAGVGALVVWTGNSSATNYGTVVEQKGFAEYYANSVSISSGTDTVITAWTVQTTDTTGLSFSSGVWTNNTGRTLQVIVTVQSAWQQNSTGVRVHYIAKSALPTAIRYIMADMPSNSDYPVITTSGTVQLSNGDSIRLAVFQNSGASQTYGGASAAMLANASSRLTLTVL